MIQVHPSVVGTGGVGRNVKQQQLQRGPAFLADTKTSDVVLITELTDSLAFHITALADVQGHDTVLVMSLADAQAHDSVLGMSLDVIQVHDSVLLMAPYA